MPRVTDSEDKGSVRADISDDVIQEALRSVERRTEKPSATPPQQASSEVPPAQPNTAVADGVAADFDVPVEVEAEGVSSPEVEALRKEVTQLQAQLDFSQSKSRELMAKLKEDHERALRAAADLDNFKKRALKEKEEVQRFGNEKLLRDFLPVIDNLERALEHSSTIADPGGFVAGVAMTRKLFEDSLARHGVKGFNAKGQPFDPNFHEAMGQAETTDMPPNHVFQEVMRGYTLNDRLIRPALVMVSKAPVAQPVPASPVSEPDSAAPAPAQDATASGGEAAPDTEQSS